MSLLFLVSFVNWDVETALCVHSFTQYMFGTGQMRVAFSIYRHSNRLCIQFQSQNNLSSSSSSRITLGGLLAVIVYSLLHCTTLCSIIMK